MKRTIVLLLVLLLLFSLGCQRMDAVTAEDAVPQAEPADKAAADTPEPTPEPTATQEPTPEPTPTPEPIPDDEVIHEFTVTMIVVNALADKEKALSYEVSPFFLEGTLDGDESNVVRTAWDGVWFQDALPTIASFKPGAEGLQATYDAENNSFFMKLDDGGFLEATYDLPELGETVMLFKNGMTCHVTFDGETAWLVYDELLAA